MNLTLGGHLLELLPSGGVLVDDILMVADLHLGKERAFRQQGVPVPEGPTLGALSKLGKEIDATGVRRLMFLGDLFHHENAIAGSTFDDLRCWLNDRPSVEATLVLGNHDRIPEMLKDAIRTVESFSIPSMAGDRLGLFHHPQDPAVPHLAGHLHPAVCISHRQDSERVRCFWRRGQMLVLPSYSEFTGTWLVDPTEDDDVFVAVGTTVRRVPR